MNIKNEHIELPKHLFKDGKDFPISMKKMLHFARKNSNNTKIAPRKLSSGKDEFRTKKSRNVDEVQPASKHQKE